jgi:diacylglycerol kinase family enzyme
VAVLLNKDAGAIQQSGDHAVCETVLSAFAQHGILAEVKMLSGSELSSAARSAADKALQKDIDAVVAAGGDGTIGTVASALVDTRIPLGIIPLGTLNHLARDLGIPLHLQDAVNVIAESNARPVDAAAVNGRIFLNNSSIGVYPFMVLERERRRRHGLAKWAAMIWATFKVMRLFPMRRFHVFAQGRSEICRTPCLFVGNNRYRLDLLGLGRRERLDGGKLWLYIAKQHTRLSLIWFTFRALLGLTEPGKDLVFFETSNAEITSKRKRLSVATDGEVHWMAPPLHYRTRPGALRIYRPMTESSRSG